jgi:tetratricopeptide (TPR) repeat protein
MLAVKKSMKRSAAALPRSAMSPDLLASAVAKLLVSRSKSEWPVSQSQTLGAGAFGVQVNGKNNTVTIWAGAAQLVLDQRHKRRAEPTRLHHLLQADWRATRLRGRDDELAGLLAWLADPAPISVHCVIGRAGTGKTRLGIELCERAETGGWVAGFARDDDLTRFFEARNLTEWAWPKPSLIVVDDAAASARILRDWLAVLAPRSVGAKDPPLRFLLLERHADKQLGWWADLVKPGLHSSTGPDELAYPDAPHPLPPLESVEDRRALLAEVIAKAAQLPRETGGVVGGKSAPLLPAAGTDAEFDRRLAAPEIDNEPLYLAMAGVVAVEAGVATALTLSSEKLVERLAASEHNRLERFAGSGIEAGLITHLAACATLQGGCDAEDALRLVEDEGKAGHRAAVAASDVVARLSAALPITGGESDVTSAADGEGFAINAVKPDLIGEMFMLRCIARQGSPRSIQKGIIERAYRRTPSRVTATVIRTILDYARDATHPSIRWLDVLVELENPVTSAMLIQWLASAVPPQLAVDLHRRVAHHLSNAQGTEAEALTPIRAFSLGQLAVLLSELGQPEEALSAAEEAAELNRQQMARRYNEGALSGDFGISNLAMSLNTLAFLRSRYGRLDEALPAAEQAATLYRGLTASNPEFRPNLAMSLNALAACRSLLGRREEALAAAEEAATLYRDLAARNPDEFRPDLAASLTVLFELLGRLGRREEAVAAAEESATLRRQLVVRDPDSFGPDLARLLNELATELTKLGRRGEALVAADEAATLYRDLAARNADAFRPNLAWSLTILAVGLVGLGRREEAEAAVDEAVRLYRDLAARDPDAFRPNLATSLVTLANCLIQLGRRGEAVAAAEEAVTLRRELTARNADAFRPHLAWSLTILALCLSVLGRREEAVAAADEAVGLYRVLAARDPDVVRPNMATSLDTLAGCLRELGRREEAMAAADESVTLLRELAAGDPDSFGPDLTRLLRLCADLYEELHRPDDALRASQDAIAALADLFLRSPQEFVRLMRPMIREYVARAEALKVEPDAKLLAPIILILAEMTSDTEEKC